MPQAVIPLVQGVLVSWGVGAGIASAVASFAVHTAFMAAFNAAAGALAKQKNKGASNLLDPAALNTLHQTTLGARQIVYGKTGIAGQIVFQHVHEDRTWISYVVQLADNGQSLPHESVEFIADKTSVEFVDGEATGLYAGVMKRRFYGGTPDQTADAQLIEDSDGRWTADHKGQGICYEVWSCKLTDEERFPNGRPEKITVVKGRRLYDRRLDSTAGGEGSHRLDDDETWEWNDNAALCADDFCRGVLFGGKRIAGLGLPTRLRDAGWTDASATVCDDEGYTINGVVSCESDAFEVLKSMELHLAGRIVPRRGRIAIIAGDDWPPVLTISEHDLAGPVKISGFRSWRDLRNVGVGTYRDPEANWEPVETEPIKVDAWITEDGGEEVDRTIFLPFSYDRVLSSRLTKIDLFRNRAPVSISAAFKLRCGKVHEGDIVTIQWPSYDIDGLFEVVSRTKNPLGFVSLTLRSWQSVSWADEEAGDPPSWDTIDRLPITPDAPVAYDAEEAPEGWAASGAHMEKGDLKIPTIIVTGDVPDGVDEVIIEYRVDGETDWQTA